jgi:hypothetical protein
MVRSTILDELEDDNFLEHIGVIVQELEVVLASGECTSSRLEMTSTER